MRRKAAVCCAVLLTFVSSTFAAGKSARTEILTCRDGTENRHARIGVVLLGGKVDSFAYYSKWKPRTCSIYLKRRGDPFSTWNDRGSVTQIRTARGQFQIEPVPHDKNAYRFVFRDVDRERYCGMDGKINGTLIVRKGSERCEVAGIMEEGTPLGQAWAHLQTPATPVTTVAAAPQPEGVQKVADRPRRASTYTFQSGPTD